MERQETKVLTVLAHRQPDLVSTTPEPADASAGDGNRRDLASGRRLSSDEGKGVHLALLGVQLTFGIYPVLAKLLLRQMSPDSLAALRALGAALVFLSLSLAFPSLSVLRPRLGRRDWLALVLGGVLGIALNQLCYLHGLALTGAMNATWISGSIPALTLLLATAVGLESPRVVNWVGVGLAFAGCLWLVGLPQWGAVHPDQLRGSLMVLAGCVLYSVYLVLIRPALGRLPTMMVVTWTYLFGAPLVVLLGWPHRREWLQIDAVGWAGIGVVIAVPTVIAYVLNNWALARARPSLVASYINVQPILVGFSSAAVLGEHLTGRLLLSGLFIFTGVLLASHRAHVPSEPVE